MTDRGPSTIALQIEESADYYPPATYAGLRAASTAYLTYYNELYLNEDPLAEDYVPLTAASKNTKLFAVGVIPPVANITGRLLDRSATANNLIPVDDATALEPIASDASAGLKGSNLPVEFWVDFVQMCKRLGVDPNELAAVLNAESGFDASSVAFRKDKKGVSHPVAKGLNQIIEKNSGVVGLGPGEWNTFENLSARQQLPYVEAYFSRCRVRGKDRVGIYAKNFGGYPNPDGSRYASAAYINGYVPPSERDKFLNPNHQEICYEQNKGLDRNGKGFITTSDLKVNAGSGPPSLIAQRIREAQQFIESGQALPVTADSNTDSFQAKGSSAASDSRRLQDKAAGTTLSATEALSNQFTAAQRAQIKATQQALLAMQNVPPLRMLINPSSFGVKGEKICSDGNWSRNGTPIIEHWGNQQDKISASGKVAGFYAVDTDNGVGPGLTRMARNYSQSWMNFQSLRLFYSNNGGLHTTDLSNADARQNLSMVGSIYLYYDNILYIGSFDSFTVTESDTTPFTAEYSFEFTVRAAFLLDLPTYTPTSNAS